MSLNISNAETCRLAAELARLTGETTTGAIMVDDVAKSTLTQVKWLIGVVAVPTVITLINMIIQITG